MAMVYHGKLITGNGGGNGDVEGGGSRSQSWAVQGAKMSPPLPGPECPLKLPLLIDASSEKRCLLF